VSRRTYADGQLVEEWDDTTRTYRDATGVRPYTEDEAAGLVAADAAAVLESTVRTRQELLAAALERLRTIESVARNNVGLRGVDPWTQGQRVAVLDAIADLSQAVRWLGQAHAAPGDTAD